MKIQLKNEVPFYIALMLQIFYVLKIITVNSYENSAIYVFSICVFSLITIANSSFNKREFIFFIMLLLTSIIHLILAENTNLLRIVMLVFSAKKIKGEGLIKFLAFAYPMIFIMVALLSINGVMGYVSLTGVWRVAIGWETRYTLGFDGPTRMMVIWLCCILSIQLYLKKTHIVRDVFFFIISLYLFKISVSFTGLIGSIIAISVPYICQYFKRKNHYKMLKYMVLSSLITVLSLTAIATLIDISTTPFGLLTNGRTYFLYESFSRGIYPTLFGGNIPDVKGLDNSYFYNLYFLGVIPMLFMICAIWRLGNVYYENMDIMGISSTVTFIFIAYITQTFEHLFINYFLFLIMENWTQFMNTQRIEGR